METPAGSRWIASISSIIPSIFDLLKTNSLHYRYDRLIRFRVQTSNSLKQG